MFRKTTLALVLALSPVQLAAQEVGTQEGIVPDQWTTATDGVLAVLRGSRPAADVFSASFLAEVPPEQLASLTSQFGAALGAEIVAQAGPASGTIVLRLERAVARGTIELDGAGKVSGLLIQKVEPIGDSVERIAADIAALPGATNAWFGALDGSAPVLELASDRPLALGSAFKIYVLAALDRAVAEGRHRWDETVPLTTRSSPNGVMQDWQQGTPVTLQTLATLMIQVSDNTATDQLMALLGRDAVEAEFLQTNSDKAPTLPFLTTRELFTLKTDSALRARYAAADELERRAILAALPEQGPPLDAVAKAFGGAPMAIDRIEWFASPASLARLLSALTGPEHATARAVLSAAKAMDPATASKWDYVGFKGGSEPGVLNYTWLLRDQAGRWHMLTLGWNDPAAPVSQATLNAIAQRILSL